MTRGEIWFAQVGRKRRPVLVLTRPEVIDVRALVTDEQAGLDRSAVINCDGLHTVTKAALTTYAGTVSEATMERVCAAVSYALGC